MKLTASSSLPVVAIAVGAELRRHGITAVLTGGACVSIYTDGSYVSRDADFVIQGRVQQAALDAALGELGFERQGDRYIHPETRFYVEFPPGPLAIGADLAIEPVEVSRAGRKALALSATDSCRDRLTAFYHWSDRQSLRLAVEIGRRQAVDLEAIRKWSQKEESLPRYREFLAELEAAPKGQRSRRRG